LVYYELMTGWLMEARLKRRNRMGTAVLCALICFILSGCGGLFVNWEAESAFENGLSLFNRGQYEQAIPYFEKAATLNPDYAQAYLYLGRSHLNLRNYTSAISPLRTAYRLAPQDFGKQIFDLLLDAFFGAARFEAQKGNFDASIGYLREMLNLDPSSRKAKEELGSMLVSLGAQLITKGNITEAVRTFSEALKLAPNNAGAYLGLARAFLKSGDFIKALDAAQKAAALDPGSNEVLRLLRELSIR
jgi:tetratricopeptide (TPR) repeat protein